MAEDQSFIDSLAALPARVTGLVELLTSLDQRVITALDSLEDMRGSITGFDTLGADGTKLIEDLRSRMVALDERVNQDLDELKALITSKLEEVDVAGFDARLDRLERSIVNIERATVSLDRSFEGGLEMLPDFLTKRMKGQGKKEAPAPPEEMP